MTFLGGGFGRKAFIDYTARSGSDFKRNRRAGAGGTGRAKMI